MLSYTELEIPSILHRKVTKHLLGHISAANNDALQKLAETETAWREYCHPLNQFSRKAGGGFNTAL